MVADALPCITLADLSRFLHQQQHPDVVVLSPADYAALLASQGTPDSQTHHVQLLGTTWIRGVGSVTALDWSQQSLKESVDGR